MEHIENLNALINEAVSNGAGGESLTTLRAMLADLPTERRGTMRDWFAGRTLTEVDTLQIKRNGRPWMPGPRMIEARATKVLLDGSSRDFKGCKVIAADDDALIVHDTSGFDTVIIYRAVAR